MHYYLRDHPFRYHASMARFRIRQIGGKGKKISVLTVPAEIARQLDPALEFDLVVTDEGLLYRAVQPGQREESVPEWMRTK